MARSGALERGILVNRVAELSFCQAESERLRKQANHANRRVSEMNERHLRCVGNELYDGPMQNIGLALLKLESLCDSGADTEDIETIRNALVEALRDIRNLSAGLFPVGMENRSLSEIIGMVARRQQRRTGMRINCEVGDMPAELPFLVKACLYRYALEGLNCAFHSSQGRSLALRASCTGKVIEMEVIGHDPGLHENADDREEYKLKLRGLCDRIQAVGGTFKIRALPSEGRAAMVARFTLEDWGAADGA